MAIKTSLLEKEAFIRSSQTLLIALSELGARFYVDTRLRRGLKELQELPHGARAAISSTGATGLTSMSKETFGVLAQHLDESYVILSYSWLDTYLSEVEEALYLNDPRSLGDNIQIKLGKILETDSIAELVHDAAKRRVRDKSVWGLKNRILELRELYGIKLAYTEQELDVIAKTRNDLVHNKKIGEFKVAKGKVMYKPRAKVKISSIDSYLHKIVNLTLDLFLEASKSLHVDRRNKGFRELERVCESFRYVFEEESQGIQKSGGAKKNRASAKPAISLTPPSGGRLQS